MAAKYFSSIESGELGGALTSHVFSKKYTFLVIVLSPAAASLLETRHVCFVVFKPGRHRRHRAQKVTVFKQIIVLKCRYCNLSFLLQSCFRFGDPEDFRLKWQHITES